ncbi:MAG: MaoC/PaaZ C-terminal domain-containing protein [Actinomycetota bacterium]
MPALSSDLVGLKGAPSEYSWNSKDAMLYACGVGARPYEDVDFLFEGKGPKVLPTFCVIGGMAGMGVMGQIEGINPALILHGGEAITLHRELPPDAKVTLEGEVTEIWDKGQAAVITISTTATDDKGPLFTASASIFARGAGGFGGERGPSTKGLNAPPEREPDHVVSDDTRIEQAAIYRLSGDRNPLHIDPEFAKMGGFDTPILHGLCTYGFVGRAILNSLCSGDPSKLKSFDARFADVVYPGDTIVTKLWVDGNEAIVQAETQKGNVVVSNAKATFS